MPMEDLESDLERALYLQNALVAHATGEMAENAEYKELRRHFLDNDDLKSLLPEFVRINRDLSQFWQFIKRKFKKYEERREYLWAEFGPVLDFLESGDGAPSSKQISETLERFDRETVHRGWTRALERKARDPEGAITAARSLLESVCKHILDDCNVEYDPNGDLHEIYKKTAAELNLSPDQHSEQVFKQILGGCSGIVNGLGTLRNRLGDAHGQGRRSVRPAARHAELAVNLAGSVATFLASTFEERGE